MSAIKSAYLEFYLGFFGDRRDRWLDVLPATEVPSRNPHACLSEKYLADVSMKGNVEDFDKHIHPCWCNPDLVYCDDLKGNEVWIHKNEQ